MFRLAKVLLVLVVSIRASLAIDVSERTYFKVAENVEELIQQIKHPLVNRISRNNGLDSEALVDFKERAPRGHAPLNANAETALLKEFRNAEVPYTQRLSFACVLLEFDNEEAKKFIEAALHGENDDQLCCAIYGLWIFSRTAKPESKVMLWVIAEMVRAVKKDRIADDEGMCCYPCMTFGERRTKEAVEPLIAIISRNPKNREAAQALGEIGDQRAVSILLQTVEVDGALLQYHILALEKLNCAELPAILLKHIDDSTAVEILARLKYAPAAGPIRKRLNQEPDQRTATDLKVALATIECKDPQELCTRLLEVLREAQEMRYMVIEALGQTKRPEIIEPLARIANSERKDSLALICCFEALGNVGNSAAVRALVKMFDNDYSWVRTKGDGHLESMRRIARTLEKITGESFRTDTEWKEWLKKTPKYRD